LRCNFAGAVEKNTDNVRVNVGVIDIARSKFISDLKGRHIHNLEEKINVPIALTFPLSLIVLMQCTVEDGHPGVPHK